MFDHGLPHRFPGVPIAALLMLLSLQATAANEWDQLMSIEEQAATGLDRLSDEQRGALREWLERYVATVNEAARQEGMARGRREERQAQYEQPVEIQSRIAGPFEGWSGRTVFRLENGQVWQQRGRGVLRFEADRPPVVIKRNALGFHTMEVPAAGRSVLVTRVE